MRATRLSRLFRTLAVGFAAGGGTDVVARIMAQKMSEILHQRSWWRTGPAPAE